MINNVDYIVNTPEGELHVESMSRTQGIQIVDELIAARKEKKMTQQDIADYTGMDRGNIGRIESKRYTPTLDVLMRYASALGMTIELNLKPMESEE